MGIDMKRIGQILRTLRSNTGKTLEQVARELNIGTSLLGMYERGERMPPPDKLALLADYYGVSVDALLARTPPVVADSAPNYAQESPETSELDRHVWKLIGGRVRRYRRISGLSVDHLAQNVGVGHQQIVRLESGMAGVPIPRLQQIAEVLGVTIGDLLQDLDGHPSIGADNMVLSFRQRGLSEKEIQKIMDYIDLIEKARGSDS
ncbi:hypothetical protein BXT84_00895 [Sulfobacillus thermotolerans]|uniref:HTH cro/C1-type domain-containing protein n=1 Tax=Sulfobacillus thermotolerans TaxID=338644 RepID=A0ABN5GWJ2_9FIRM|nr:hypothetical protein BXT84_00895 [Sulfobacillus thermotolerans]